MNPTPVIPFLNQLAVHMAALSLPVTMTQEISLGVAAVILVIGMTLCWQAPHQRMSIEENAKDGKLTEEQARSKIRQVTWTGPAVVIAGVVMLGLTLLP